MRAPRERGLARRGRGRLAAVASHLTLASGDHAEKAARYLVAAGHEALASGEYADAERRSAARSYCSTA